MRHSPIPHARTFKHGALLALLIWLVVLPLTFLTELIAPSLFLLLAGIGNFQFKPWIFLAPTVCVLIAAVLVLPGYRTLGASVGAAVCSVAVVVAATIVFILVITTIPRLHF